LLWILFLLYPTPPLFFSLLSFFIHSTLQPTTLDSDFFFLHASTACFVPVHLSTQNWQPFNQHLGTIRQGPQHWISSQSDTRTN
jgi:hypothetical protein